MYCSLAYLNFVIPTKATTLVFSYESSPHIPSHVLLKTKNNPQKMIIVEANASKLIKNVCFIKFRGHITKQFEKH